MSQQRSNVVIFSKIKLLHTQTLSVSYHTFATLNRPKLAYFIKIFTILQHFFLFFL